MTQYPRLTPEQARKLHKLEAGTATREELAELAQLELDGAIGGLATGTLERAALEAVAKWPAEAKLPPSQDTPGLGGVPLDGIEGQWITTADLHAAATREELEDLEPSAELERDVWTVAADPAGLELPEGRVLRVVPGDVVMFAFPDSALIDIEAVNRAIEGILPDGVTALVLSDGVEVTRITADYATGYRDGYGHADNGLDAVIPEDTADAIAADAAPIADATADALRRRSRGTDPRFEAR